jgi:hypothetical protein
MKALLQHHYNKTVGGQAEEDRGAEELVVRATCHLNDGFMRLSPEALGVIGSAR